MMSLQVEVQSFKGVRFQNSKRISLPHVSGISEFERTLAGISRFYLKSFSEKTYQGLTMPDFDCFQTHR